MTKSGVSLICHWLIRRRSGGLDPELTKWSVRLGPAMVLTGKGYKEHHWLVIPFINLFGYPFTSSPSAMPSSSHTIPGSINQLGIGWAAIRVCGQTSHRTNQGHAIMPFMFNKEGYRVSVWPSLLHMFQPFCLVCPRRGWSGVPLGP